MNNLYFSHLGGCIGWAEVTHDNPRIRENKAEFVCQFVFSFQESTFVLLSNIQPKLIFDLHFFKFQEAIMVGEKWHMTIHSYAKIMTSKYFAMSNSFKNFVNCVF